MTAVSSGSETAGWSRRSLRIALLGSLALNLLCIGLIGGALFKGPPHRPHTEFGLIGFSRTLPADRAAVLRDTLAPHRPQFRELRQTARAARLEATDALVADAYDKEKVRASLVKVDDAETKMRLMISNLFVDAGEKLTPAERRELAEWWKRRQPRLFWRQGDKPEDEPGSAAGK